MSQLSLIKYLRGLYNVNLREHTTHHAIIQSIYDLFIMTQGDMDLARAEMCLTTATGRWLDEWGSFFSVYRNTKEDDRRYCQRIIDSIIQPKSTVPAIKSSLASYLNSRYNKSYTSSDISIREPWMELSRYSHRGTLSSTAKFSSPGYYSHAIIDISIPEKVDHDTIVFVNSIKAAGVKVMWSILNNWNVITEFYDSDKDNYAGYHRRTQLRSTTLTSSGLVLSAHSQDQRLSGKRSIWELIQSTLMFYVKVQDKDTDDSIIISKRDIVNMIDWYIDPDGTGELHDMDSYIVDGGSLDYVEDESRDNYVRTAEHLARVTDDLIESFKALDKFMTLSSQEHRLSTSTGMFMTEVAETRTYHLLLDAISTLKNVDPVYYASMQPPIIVGNLPVNWYVAANKNWLFDSPILSFHDLIRHWEPEVVQVGGQDVELVASWVSTEGDATEQYDYTLNGQRVRVHTLQDMEDFERLQGAGFITINDYNGPIVVSDQKRYLTTQLDTIDMRMSPVFTMDDLADVASEQLAREGISADGSVLINTLLAEQYRGAIYHGDYQGPIQVTH